MRRIATQVSLLMWGAVLALLLAGCAGSAPAVNGSTPDGGAPDAAAPEVVDHLELAYATQFDVARLSDGTYLLTIGDADRYLLVPDGQGASGKAAAGTAADAMAGIDATVISIPVDDVYLAASSTMSMPSL